MTRDLKILYAAISDNKIVFFETNLSKFVDELNNRESNSRNYDYYSKQFKKNDLVEFDNKNGKKYFLQKAIPERNK